MSRRGQDQREAFWDVECDILIPAALEGQITADRARRIRAKLVLEGANGPTLAEAYGRGVLIVPDVICNAGGVTVGYFEWVQDFSSYFWTQDDIDTRLETIILKALRDIWDTADRLQISLRTATFVVACERILMARQERGLPLILDGGCYPDAQDSVAKSSFFVKHHAVSYSRPLRC
jgi:glutamate dehydrogenase (NAD(P)+)